MNGILMDYLTIKSMGNHQTSEVSNWQNQELGEFPLGPSHAWCGVGTQRRDVKHRWVIWCFGLEERSLWKKWNGGVLGECLWILLLAVYSVGIRCNMHHWDPLMSSFFYMFAAVMVIDVCQLFFESLLWLQARRRAEGDYNEDHGDQASAMAHKPPWNRT